jgi:hypothetical protein
MTLQEPHGADATKHPSTESRDWLVLSLKWSTGDWLCWYRTGRRGYTQSLIHAGRYTEAEARSEETGSPTNCMAVSLDKAVEHLAAQVVLRNDSRLIRRLKRLSKPTKAVA